VVPDRAAGLSHLAQLEPRSADAAGSTALENIDGPRQFAAHTRKYPCAPAKAAPYLQVIPTAEDPIEVPDCGAPNPNATLTTKAISIKPGGSRSALARLGAATALEPRYALRAPRGRPFFVLGAALTSFIDPAGNPVSNDLVNAFRIDLPAREDDQLLDIDLATIPALPSRTLRMRAELPQVAGTPFGAGTRALASVLSADSALTLGIFSSSTATSDARAFDLSVTLVTTDIAPERPLTQAVLIAPDGSRSVRTEQGIAAEGTNWNDFAAPPTVRDPDAPRTARDPIPLDGFPPGAELTVRVLAGGQLFWIQYGPPGGPRASSFTIPYRDEIASTDVQVFAVSVVAQSDRVDLPSYGSFYRRAASSRDLRVSKR